MNARALRLAGGGLLLALALLLALFAALPTAAGATDGLPAIEQFKTAHVAMELKAASSAEPDEAFAFGGEGDIDIERRAARFAFAFEDQSFEMVSGGGRLYFRDPDTGKWEWTDSGAGSGPDADADFLGLGDLAAFGGADIAWQRVGTERLDGASTTHWRARLDAGDLANAYGGDDADAADMFTFDLTLDLWLGDANGYIYRYALGMAFGGSDPDAGGATTAVSLTFTMVFSKHDQPVVITPPVGATPAASDSDFGGDVLSALPALPTGANFALPAGFGAGQSTGFGAPRPTPAPASSTEATVAARRGANPTLVAACVALVLGAGGRSPTLSVSAPTRRVANPRGPHPRPFPRSGGREHSCRVVAKPWHCAPIRPSRSAFHPSRRSPFPRSGGRAGDGGRSHPSRGRMPPAGGATPPPATRPRAGGWQRGQ